MAAVIFPQIYRNIFRIVVIVAIFTGAGIFAMQSTWQSSGPISESVSKMPRNVNLRLEYAKELESSGKLGEARQQVATVLDFDPLNPYATSFYNELGSKSGNLEPQIKAILEILAKRPDYQKAWIKLATLYEYEGKTLEAGMARQKAQELSKRL